MSLSDLMEFIWTKYFLFVKFNLGAIKVKLFIQQKNSVDASVVLGVVGDLSVLAPDHFSSGCHKTQLADVHLNDCTLRDNTLETKRKNPVNFVN